MATRLAWIESASFLEDASSFFARSSFSMRFLLSFVTFGERIYSASSILETEETEMCMSSRSARSSE